MGKGAAQKVAVLGIDALDPRLTKKYVEMGLMPNMKKYIEAWCAKGRSRDVGRPSNSYTAYVDDISNGCVC